MLTLYRLSHAAFDISYLNTQQILIQKITDVEQS